MNTKKVSILVPMYDESEVLPLFFPAIKRVLDELDEDWEVVCIDDGSTDNTLELLERKALLDDRIKIVSFSRNFGKESAMTAAIDYATGDAVIPIDADLQDPPEVILQMIEKWHSGFDMIYAKRSSRVSDSIVKRKTASWFYALFNKMAETPIPENVGDYRLMDRKIVEVIKLLPEKERFMKGLYSWPGFKVATIEFEREARADGETKFNYWRLWNFALSGITSFSTIPIRMGTYVGMFVSFMSFVYGLIIVSRTMIFGIDVPGYASLLVVVLFLGGIQLVFLGLLGEYIGRIYKEVKNRPLYVVNKAIGFNGA